MKPWRLPLWLLRDVPAFVGVMFSFWSLMILVITNGFAAMRGAKVAKSVFDAIPILLAEAEARLDFALWREAYRRLGWNHRVIPFTAFAPPTWADAEPRFEACRRASMNLEDCVRSYVGHLRAKHSISARDLVAHGSTDARLCRAAHHELVGAFPFALIRPSTCRAEAARRRKDERGPAHARGPPLRSFSRNRQPPTSQASPARTHRHVRTHPCRRILPRALSRQTDQAATMSLFSFARLLAAAVLLALSTAALAQTPTDAPEDGAAFQCSDGSKMVLSFTDPIADADTDTDESGAGISALVWLHGASYQLAYLPPEPGPVQVVWSDGEHELTWSPGVHLMWMASDAHLMCGRGEHKH